MVDSHGLERVTHWRKSVGVEPTRDRLTAPTGFEVRRIQQSTTNHSKENRILGRLAGCRCLWISADICEQVRHHCATGNAALVSSGRLGCTGVHRQGLPHGVFVS